MDIDVMPVQPFLQPKDFVTVGACPFGLPLAKFGLVFRQCVGILERYVATITDIAG